jgi:hypothetical protein
MHFFLTLCTREMIRFLVRLALYVTENGVAIRSIKLRVRRLGWTHKLTGCLEGCLYGAERWFDCIGCLVYFDLK